MKRKKTEEDGTEMLRDRDIRELLFDFLEDTYGKIRDYDLYYDLNYAVVGTSHTLYVEEHLPDWWGIITVEEVEGRADTGFSKKEIVT